MSTQLPHSSIDFKKNEISTLAYIQARGFFDNDFSDLATAISSTYNSYRGVAVKKKNFDFQFESDFEIEIEGKNRHITLHAIARGDYELTTYSIGICSDTNPSQLIRRFHFDYVHKTGGIKQKVPVSHLQYGGKTASDSVGKAFSTDNLEDWLSEPRLYFPPINIALLFDIAFTEFKSEKTRTIVNNPDWRSLVRTNEIFAFKDYYRRISGHIDTHNHDKLNLVRDICYV